MRVRTGCASAPRSSSRCAASSAPTTCSRACIAMPSPTSNAKPAPTLALGRVAERGDLPPLSTRGPRCDPGLAPGDRGGRHRSGPSCDDRRGDPWPGLLRRRSQAPGMGQRNAIRRRGTPTMPCSEQVHGAGLEGARDGSAQSNSTLRPGATQLRRADQAPCRVKPEQRRQGTLEPFLRGGRAARARRQRAARYGRSPAEARDRAERPQDRAQRHYLLGDIDRGVRATHLLRGQARPRRAIGILEDTGQPDAQTAGLWQRRPWALHGDGRWTAPARHLTSAPCPAAANGSAANEAEATRRARPSTHRRPR